ncbi:MAG: hypothetical protein ACM3PW_11790 [Chlamydiota bacterium]
MKQHRPGLLPGAVALIVAILTSAALAASGPATAQPQVISDSQLQALTTTIGGASVLPTTRTIPHWWGSTVNPDNGVTYGYNMVGADPSTCPGAGCSVTIQADITPVIVHIDGLTFSGNDVLAATLASPQFALNDYGSTPFATAAGAFPNAPALIQGPGGALSQLDAGVQLQLQDATMRALFNKTGTGSNYHVMLHPNVLPAITINVPLNQGVLLQSGRGVIFADINISWWASQIQNLETSADPTHLAIYLTNNVLLHVGQNVFNCCVIGFHGTRAAGDGGGSNNSNGNAKVQTFAWASWVQPGIYARANGGTYWALQDIHALSHEIAEWAEDPFVNNTVEPWATPTAPQYGCSGILESGDPVVAIGFAMGSNSFEQGPNPDGSQSADSYYHPEDEVFLPWFMRTAPNTVSEPTQSASANIGRYSLMGDLNPFAGFRQPATGCQ